MKYMTISLFKTSWNSMSVDGPHLACWCTLGPCKIKDCLYPYLVIYDPLKLEAKGTF